MNMSKFSATLFASFLISNVAFADECPKPPYVYFAEITEVYDGNTVTADIDLGFHTWRREEKLRLYGTKAPSIRGDNREQGLESRDWLRSQVLGKKIMIQTIKVNNHLRGKSGRYITALHLREGKSCINLNDELVKNGLAVNMSN